MKKSHGGARKGAGKPALYGKAMIRKNVMLNPETIEILKALGGGNLSEGIRKAAEHCVQADVKPGPAEEVELYREQLEIAHEEIMRKASRR